MEQYISKAAVVAEIKKLISNGKLKCQQSQENNDQVSYIAWSEHIATCGKILSFLNTLEVKEVDLEKEIISTCRSYRIREFSGAELNKHDIEWIAKYFFELGIKARIDKELVDEVYSHIDSIKDTADRMTSGNFMHNIAAIKFSVNTIAKVLELIGLKALKGE